MASTDSIIDLFSQLCNIHMQDRKRAYLVQPLKTKDYKHRKLKALAYDTVFQYLKGPHKHGEAATLRSKLGELEKVYASAFSLRCQRKFDEANQLEKVVELFLNGPGDLSIKRSVLRVLLCLAGTGTSADNQPIGHKQPQLPLVFPNKDQLGCLPEGPLYYGDTRLQMSQERWYMHYPRHLFELPGITEENQGGPGVPIMSHHIFEMIPGTSATGNIQFDVNGFCGSAYHREQQTSLFGALVHSLTNTTDVKLDLPELPDEFSHQTRELTFPKPLESCEDEGFVDTLSRSSSDLSPAEFPERDVDIWDLALSCKLSKHYVWECVGRHAQITEKPYMTEGGPEVFDKLWKLHMRELQLIAPDLSVPVQQPLPMKQLVRDVINVLIGLPSTTFLLSQDDEEFRIREGVCITGTSPETIRETCGAAMECGSLYWRLCRFSQAVIMDSNYTAGLIFQAFASGIRKYLQHYRGCVLSIDQDKTLLEINFLLYKVMQQVRYLADVCWCSNPKSSAPTGNDEEATFPKGLQLLSYLYQECLDTVASEHYRMLLSLLHASCGPYIMFVQDWVFHGVCRDVYEEFMIKIDDNYLEYRDKHYWTHGYNLVAKEAEDTVPSFLRELANGIFVCGKSINLLRLCCPQHFLFTVEHHLPQVQITFSEEELNSIENSCQAYLSRMLEIARRNTNTRNQMIERAQQAKHDLMVQARRVAARELDRLQTNIQNMRISENIKKRKLFAELKKQMELDLERRENERRQEREEDKDRVDAVTKQEIVEATVEAEVEQQAREELIEYYEKLTEQAAYREQKSLWRVRRLQLNASRRDFVQQQEDLLNQQLQLKQLADQSVEPVESPVYQAVRSDVGDDESLATSLQTTAAQMTDKQIQVGVDGTRSLADMTDQERDTAQVETTSSQRAVKPDDDQIPVGDVTARFPDKGLPKWAQEGLKQLRPAFGLDSVITDDMPDWAKRNIDTDVPLLVNDSESVSFKSEAKENDKNSKSMSRSLPSAATVGDHRVDRQTKVHSGKSDPARDPAVNIPCGEVTASETKKKETEYVDDESNSELRSDPDEDLQRMAQALTPKSLTKRVGERHVSEESQPDDTAVRSSVRVLADVLAETQQQPEKPSLKNVSGVHVSKETEEDFARAHIKTGLQMSATKESEPEEERRMHLRTFEDKHVSNQSQEDHPSKSHIKLSSTMHSCKQSAPQPEKKYKPSVYGHVSEISHGDYVIQAPKLRRGVLHANTESDYYTYQIKPHRKKVISQFVEQESDEVDYKSHVRFNDKMHATKESEYLDTDKIRLDKFRSRNLYGHSSDSTVQRLLYGRGLGDQDAIEAIPEEGEYKTSSDLHLWSDSRVVPYDDQFDFLDAPPMVDLLSQLQQHPMCGLQQYSLQTEGDINAHQYISLPTLLKRSVTAPLLAQISLVNHSVVQYFLGELSVEEHFQAMRQFLLMQDGEFGQSLGDQLFEKLSSNPQPHEMLNPMFLNSVLSKALRASMHGDSQYARHVNFTVKYLPSIIQQHSPGALDCLELAYKVDWPVNIVITDTCGKKYHRVFALMFQLMRAVWVLKDVFHKLKRDAIINDAGSGFQFRQLQLFRHEMQHFVKVMQGYITNQIIDVSWQEFQDDLTNKVRSLDDLHDTHGAYINKCLFRCLLNKRAAPVMKIIQDIFGLIIKFHTLLKSQSWQRRSSNGHVTHPAFQSMCATYKSFSEYSKFLFKVVAKLAMKGYQPHFQQLLLRLNFNGYYKAQI